MKGILVLALSFLYCIGFAQQPYVLPQITPKSPNVASFEKYGNVPVSLSTGIPNISIPLTSFTVDGLTIPIQLIYHNNGLKVEEIPSMMGLGWDLDMGGVISYNQRGINDFNSSANGMQTAYSYVRDFFNGVYVYGTQQRFDFLQSILHSQQDSEFDFYNLNFLGHSGTFYFDTTGIAYISPKNDLKIFKIDTGLKVIDNSGNQFFFQKPEVATSYESVTTYISPSFSDISAWHLSRVITKNGREIRYAYKPYQLQYSKTVQSLDFFPNNCGTNANNSSDVLITQTCLLPDSILFDQGYVKFILSSSPRADILQSPISDSIPSLTGFFVANTQGQKVSEFNFSQGYFDSNARLKLTSVQEKAGSQIGRNWEFHYFGESSSFPDFLSKAQDHWGYYNGVTTNTTLIPEAKYKDMVGGHYVDQLHGNYANRRSNFNYAKFGMLQTIKYPTGGTTSFDYDPNQVRVKRLNDILGNPFLKWTSALPTMTQTLASGNTNYTGTTSDSFTITDSTVVYLTAFSEEDYPSHLNSAAVGFTGPTGSVAALYNTYTQILTNYYTQGFGEVVLEPGTYGWSVYQGYNYDINLPLQATLEITTQILDSTGALPPFQMPGGRISSIISYDSIANIRNSSKKYVYDDSLDNVVVRNIPYYISSTNYNHQVAGGCVFCDARYTIAGESIKPFIGSNIEYPHVTEFEDTSGVGGKTEFTFLTSTDEGGNNAKPYIGAFNTSWRVGSILSEKIYKFDTGAYTMIQQTNNGFHIGTREHVVNGFKVDVSEYSPVESIGCYEHITGLSTLFSELFYKNQSEVKEILGDTVTNITNITAGSSFHTLPTLTEKFDSEGRSIKEKTIYSFDFDTSHISSPEAIGIRDLVRKNILVPIEKIQIKTIHDTDYIVASTLYTYKPGKAVVDTIFSLKVTSPLLYTAYTLSNINGSGIFIKDGHYERRLIENKFDLFNNVVEQQKSTDVKAAYVWDYNLYYPIAEIINADSGSVAYTSFEASGNGNWSVGGSSRDTTQSITGHTSYQLSNGNLTKTGLTDSIEYSLSYWTKNSSAFSITGTQGTIQQGKTINGWTCFLHKLKGVTQVTLSGSGILDEVRLCPWSAQMTTYTYDPLIGVTSQCDARNSIYYYEYDGFSRLKRVRDQDGNILKSYNYTYQEQQ